MPLSTSALAPKFIVPPFMLNVLPLFSSSPLSVNVPPVFWFSVPPLLIVSVLPLGTLSWPVLVYVPAALVERGVVVHVHGAAIDQVASEVAAPRAGPDLEVERARVGERVVPRAASQ